ncbi:hypothetical protein HMPREF1870_00560 [Bacteroidales bacterium KA00344]|nr:hypothetical protein HMPREF1870_00560 [Bacteroidales bacterium KA00344]
MFIIFTHKTATHRRTPPSYQKQWGLPENGRPHVIVVTFCIVARPYGGMACGYFMFRDVPLSAR